MIRKLKEKIGFTLVEVLLTVIIIAIGLFGLMVLYNNAAHSVMEGDVNLMATYLARERLEQMISDKAYRGYDYVVNENYDTSTTVSVGNNYFTRSFNIYEVYRSDLITPLDDSGFKRIDMMVSWGSSGAENITIPTLITDY